MSCTCVFRQVRLQSNNDWTWINLTQVGSLLKDPLDSACGCIHISTYICRPPSIPVLAPSVHPVGHVWPRRPLRLAPRCQPCLITLSHASAPAGFGSPPPRQFLTPHGPSVAPTAKYQHMLPSIVLNANYKLSPRLNWQLMALEQSCPVICLTDVSTVQWLLLVFNRLAAEWTLTSHSFELKSPLIQKETTVEELFIWRGGLWYGLMGHTEGKKIEDKVGILQE